MEEKLKILIAELGHVVDDEVWMSHQVAEVVESAKDAGYEVSLGLELTVGFAKREV